MSIFTGKRWQTVVTGGVLAIIIAGLALVTHRPSLVMAAGTTYYVSKVGNNADGRSWATAWNELSQINWGIVQPGDTILVDGGTSQMVYQSTLTLGKSGTSSAPITIRLASDPGRNGKAVIFGGRSTPLPYCDQASYSYQTAGVRSDGIEMGSNSWVVIDGTKWRGITIYGHNRYGIYLHGGSANIRVRNVEIYDNGTATSGSSGWKPNQEGVRLSGTNVTFERVIVHDNGQDAFQSGGGVANFTLRDSLIYNGRKAPDGSVWNMCTHPDGVQIYGGGDQYGVTIDNSVMGPGFMQGVLLGQSLQSNGNWATLHDVTIKNSLFYGNGNANIHSHNPPTAMTGWVIQNVTSDKPVGATWHNIVYTQPSGSPANLAIQNSIFSGGYLLSVPSNGAYSGSGYWQVKPNPGVVGINADPQYADSSAYGSGSLSANFGLKSTSPYYGKGSPLTSAAQLLGSSSTAATATPVPSSTATPTPAPAYTSTPTPMSTYTPTPAPTQATLSTLAWEAESGTIYSPFAVSNGSVGQAIETVDPTLGGRVSYKFNITSPGDYEVAALLNAPDNASNSLFIDIDGEPTSPTMIWDILPTIGFEQRTASWRGNGTVTSNEFTPKVFSLTVGTHELVIRGRERNVRLDQIRLLLVTPVVTATPTLQPTAAPSPTAIATPTLQPTITPSPTATSTPAATATPRGKRGR